MTYITGGAVQLSGTTSLIDLPGISAPSLSAPNHGKIYFDLSSESFKLSVNGGAYVSLLTPPGGSTGQLQYNNAGAFAGSSTFTISGNTLTNLSGIVNFTSGFGDTGRMLGFNNGTIKALTFQPISVSGIGAYFGTNPTTAATLGYVEIAAPLTVDTSAGITSGHTGLASALFTLNSTTQGALVPRMTTTQKNAIVSPATGLLIYDTTLNLLQIYNGSLWGNVSPDTDTGITQLTGDATAGPGSGSQALTLATVNANVGSFTSANITVNAKGLITAASSGTAGVGGSGTTDKIARWSNSSTLAAGAITDNGTTVLIPTAPIIQVNSGGSTATASFITMQDVTTSGLTSRFTQTTIASQTFSSITNIFSVPQGSAGEVTIIGKDTNTNTYFIDRLVWVNSTGTAAISGVYATIAQGAVARSYTVLGGQLRLQMSGNVLNYRLNVFSRYC